ncbi:MAG: proline reductase cluster protein PrdD [Tissierellales bacterium]|jgi:D-proline reductase (dithiol) PrdD|nr:proline reductase cluster protein PrdD [Tissierellales bacterium]
MNEIELRRLVIKAFHVKKVILGEKDRLKNQVLEISLDGIQEIEEANENIIDIKVDIIEPGDHNREINTIMDIVPISTKVIGKIGEGITHTITGAYFMLTGADEEGNQMHEFGSSEGLLSNQLVLDRAGTPGKRDYIIHMDVKLRAGVPFSRELANAAFEAGDKFIQNFRQILKRIDGRECTESHEYYDKIRPGKKKVVLIKQIAGQGAMYDNRLLASEPSGFIGGRSIIDMGNVPVILSPNEYRDGALRSLE